MGFHASRARVRCAAALFLGCAAGFPCAAQRGGPLATPVQPAAPVMPDIPRVSPSTPSGGPVTIKSRVTLVSAPVVVRDSDGRAIGSLTRDDFEITDNGKRQTISKFAVEKFTGVGKVEVPAGAPTPNSGPPQAPNPAMPDRYVAFFFDDLSMAPSELAQAREAAWRYMKNSIRPTERVALATSSGLTTLDFTDDLGRMRKTLDAIQPRASIVLNAADCPPMSIFEAELIAIHNDPMALGTAVGDYLACSQSSMSADEAAFPVTNFARMQVNLADRALRTTLGSLDGLCRKMAVMAGQRTVVMVSSGFQMLDDRRQDEIDVMERAIRAGIVVNALDARALYSLIPGGGAGERTVNGDATVMNGYIGGVAGPYGSSGGSIGSTLVARARYVNQEALAKRAAMAEVASATGGRFFENSNDLDSGYQRLAAAPEYIYVLGFSPQDLKEDGKFHALKVSLRRAQKVTIEARRGYYAPRPANDGDRTKEEIQDTFFSRDETADLPVWVETEYLKTGDNSAKLTVLTTVDVRSLQFRKDKERNRTDVTLVAGLFDANGNYISGMQKLLELRLLDSTLAKNAGAGITVRNAFDVPPGKYLVRVVVRDSSGESMASRSTSVEIP